MRLAGASFLTKPVQSLTRTVVACGCSEAGPLHPAISFGLLGDANPMPTKTVLDTPRIPRLGPYSQAVRVGDLIFTAGQAGIDRWIAEVQHHRRRIAGRLGEIQPNRRTHRRRGRAGHLVEFEHEIRASGETPRPARRGQNRSTPRRPADEMSIGRSRVYSSYDWYESRYSG